MVHAVLDEPAQTASQVQPWLDLLGQSQPDGWSADNDLLLVCGAPDAALQAALHTRGQRRVLWLDAGASEPRPGAAAPLEWRVLPDDGACADRIEAHIASLRRPLPRQVLRLRMPQVPATTGQDQALSHIQGLLMQRWTDDRTREHFAHAWLEQGLANLPALARQHNLAELDGLFAGRPAILIAPGPSLDRNIDQLRQAQGHAVLIAPLQSLRRLRKAGVRPDVLLVLDATDLTCEPYDFIGDIPADELPPLVAAVNAHPNVIARFSQVFYFAGGGPVDHWLADMLARPLVDLKARSVALSALLLAQHWRCNPIALVGQDLALADDGQRYARGAQLNAYDQPQHLHELPGYHGGTVLSPADYHVFHQDFVRLAPLLQQARPGLRLFNCTEGGAFIPGFEHRPLHELLALLPADEPARADLPPVGWPVAPDANRCAQQLEQVQAYLAGQRKALASCERQAQACRQLALKPQAGPAYLKRLEAAERELREAMRRVKGFSILYRSEIDAARQAAAQARNLAENLAASRQLYAVVAQGCVHLRGLLDTVTV